MLTRASSGIITKGLGLPACCGLLTMGFGVFACKIQVLPPISPGIGGGGGSFAVHPEVYRPYSPKTSPKRSIIRERKTVKVSVKYRRQVWNASFSVSIDNADIIVKAINVATHAQQKYRILVDAISKRMSRSANSDKSKD